MLGDLPQWDLNDLYASINDSKLSSDKIEIEELTEIFINKYQNKIATLSSEKLNEAIRDYQTINQKLGKLYSYVSLTFSINTDKPDFGKKYQEIRELGSIIFSKLVFFELEIAYDSEEAKEINKLIFETIYFGALEASHELAKEKGAYSTFNGSPLSEGKFQFDMWDITPSGMWDWETLRGKIKKDGARNSLTTACMPTASTGIILGNTETFQIQTSNIYKRQTLSGEFLLVNRHLVKALSKRNLWNKEMRDKIILENGSVQNISNFPEDLKETYKTVWETSQKSVIDMAADRAPFIDQTQSMNLWLSTPTFGKVNSMHMYAWKKGLKTGMYYLRSRSAVDAVKVTVSSEKAAKEAYINTAINQNNEPEECETCSA